MKQFLLCCVLIGTAVSAQQADTGRIDLQITGIPNDRGKVMVAVFDGPDGFPMDYRRARFVKEVKPSGSQVSVVFDAIPAGTYAVAVMHDEDGNGVLNRALFGIPTEAWGASNNAKGRFGPPSFTDAEFRLESASTLSMTIRVSRGAHW